MTEIQPEVPEVPVAPAMKRIEYQPTDEDGRPLGGKQVIEYTDEADLAVKIQQKESQLVRRLREVSRQQRLGIPANESIPNDAEKFESVVEFRPRDLSAEERYQISQELNDPEKFVDARDRLLESAVGVKPSVLTQTLNDQQLYIMQLRARDNYVDFVSSKAGYFDSPKNRETMTDWMWKNRLAPTVKNFNLAYSTLQEAGLLQGEPVVQQAQPAPAPEPVVPPEPVAVVDAGANPQPPVSTPVRINESSEPASKAQRAHVPSGLNERVSSANGQPAVDGNTLTLKQIDALPSEVLKAKLRDSVFRKHYDTLLAEAEKKNRERGLVNF